MRTRLTLVAALATAALVSNGAQAAAGAKVADATGDAITQQSGHDIVSVSVRSTRAGKGANAPVKDFTISLTTAGPMQLGLGTVFAVEATVEGCGTFRVKRYRGAFGTIFGPEVTADHASFGCIDDPHPVWGPIYTVNTVAKVDHDTISWTIRGTGVPGFIKPGTAFKDLHAYVAPAEPGGGNSTAQYERGAAIDTTPSVTWRYGS